jgi:CheY-like chemotaxis protein
MSTILIVDDEESIRDVAAAILEKQGHATVRAADADAAFAAIEAGGIDLALVDVVLPGRGGLDLLMQVRADHPTLPVVVMSGKVRPTPPRSEPWPNSSGPVSSWPNPSRPANSRTPSPWRSGLTADGPPGLPITGWPPPRRR